MKVLITGATGFVGSHLCKTLSEKGYKVFALVRTPSKKDLIEAPVSFIRGSLQSDSKNSWIENLPDDLDTVYHLAGIVHEYDTEKFFKINFEATKQLFFDLRARYPKLNFIYLSSMAAAGPNLNERTHLLESEQASPVSDYGRSKKQAEDFLLSHVPSTWKLQIFRPPMIIGPKDPAVLDVFKMVKKGFVPIIGLGGHKKEYSFICVFDLIEILARSLDTINEHSHKIYFTTNPHPVSFEDIITSIKVAQNRRHVQFVVVPFFLIRSIAWFAARINRIKKIKARITPDKLFELKPMRWVCSGEKLEKDFNFTYKWGLHKSVRITQEDYQNRGWL